MLLSEQILCHTLDSSCYLFGVVDEELSVVHAREEFDVGLRAEGQEVLHLRFGDFCAEELEVHITKYTE